MRKPTKKKSGLFKDRKFVLEIIITIVISIIIFGLGLLWEVRFKEPTISPSSQELKCGIASRDFKLFLRNNENVALYNVQLIIENAPKEGFNFIPEDKNAMYLYSSGLESEENYLRNILIGELAPNQNIDFTVIYENISCNKTYKTKFYLKYNKEPIEGLSIEYNGTDFPEKFPK